MLKLKVTVQYFALLFCVFDALGSNPGAEIYYPLLGLSRYSSFAPGNLTMTVSLQIVPALILTSYPTIRGYRN